MRKRNKAILYTKKQFIFFSLIISMSIIGVGYAEWNDSASISMSINTGFSLKEFNDKSIIPLRDGEYIELSVSKDGSTLNITGDIYPTFNEELTINLIDNGSVPSVINDIKVERCNDSKSLQRNNNIYSFNKKDDLINININANIFNNEVKSFNDNNFSIKDEELSIENRINNQLNNINSYKKVEKLNIKYVITYELENGGWSKNLYINCNLNVIPDPEEIKKMELKLQGLEEQKQKALDEQLKLLKEQKLLEEQKIIEEQKISEQNNIEQNQQNENDIINENSDSEGFETTIIQNDESNNSEIKDEDKFNLNIDSNELEQELTNVDETNNEQNEQEISESEASDEDQTFNNEISEQSTESEKIVSEQQDSNVELNNEP